MSPRQAALALVFAVAALTPRPAEAQLGALVSPGPLAKAHASLEGAANCQKCHVAGRRVTVEKCLACHLLVAERLRLKKGIHRDTGGDCVKCHPDHMGVDAQMRKLDTRTFDHATTAEYALDGKHAGVKCEGCHKTRSFLTAQRVCASCHKDTHRGQHGNECGRCHTLNVTFKETRTRFDHSRTRFALIGGHVKVECAKCHPKNRYDLLMAGAVSGAAEVAACNACHRTPHRAPLGQNCTTCHTSENWKSEKIEHERTGYPLKGEHADAECASCHRQSSTKVMLKFQKCADCHADPHRARFKEDCAKCHNERSFRGAPFDHGKQTPFVLAGAHIKVKCDKCHKRGGPAAVVPPPRPGAQALIVSKAIDFRGLKSDCVSCHKDVHRGETAPDCRVCHGSATFHEVKYVHKKNTEFFGGNHAPLTCGKCHGPKTPPLVADGLVPPFPRLMLAKAMGSGLVLAAHGQSPQVAGQRAPPSAKEPPVALWRFKGLTTDCASCHKDPHLGQLGATCDRCHTVAAKKYAAAKFSHASIPFALTGLHAPVACDKCHKRETGTFASGTGTAVRYKGVANECRACHKDTHLGQLGKKCELCHNTTNKAFATPGYRHVLRPDMSQGRHVRTECQKCHKKQEALYPDGSGVATRYIGFGDGCAPCHDDVHKGTLGGTCQTCHSVESFKAISRAFHKGGSFPLEGRHMDVPCTSCHVNGQLKGTPSKCYDCHWVRRQDDRYRLRLGMECETCHRPVSWTATRWSHVGATGVALNATHRILGCDSCHRQLEFKKGIAVDCASCHIRNYQQAAQPNHMQAGFPLLCDTCHRPSDPDWHRATFDHRSTYSLVGPHAQAACASCHRGTYRGTPRECIGCHQTNYQGAKQPNHVAAGFSTNCEPCHRATDPDWHRATFNHDQFFELDGKHRAIQCVACHPASVYKGTPRDCIACHRADYERAQNPNHAASGFSTDCQLCHRYSASDWHSANFNHDTMFRLEGMHRAADCARCHANGRYAGTPQACFACHQANYERAQNPNHVASGFSTECQQCHRAADANWRGATFNHDAVFRLEGLHRSTACAACHPNGRFAGTPRDCIACHRPDYERTQNPNHAAARFSTDCRLCHRPSDPSWRAATFNHDTIFRREGMHQTAPCASCHSNGRFAGTPRQCVSCHRPDYERAQNPNHVAAGYSTDCLQCHRGADPTWRSANFNHDTVFRLEGLHRSAQCVACHPNNRYAGTPRQCVECHRPNYERAQNPNHVTSGFSTDCQQCHRASDPTWTSATFNHDTTFRLEGVHRTAPCATCHPNGRFAGTPRDCVSCHRSAYDRTQNPNHVAAGFPTTCATCHRAADPNWSSGIFNHDTVFRLEGTHRTAQCATCHRNGVYRGTPRTCSGCHLATYNATTNPNHVAAGFPTTCETCHRAADASWTMARFTHLFPITSGPHRRPCADCHRDPSNYRVFSCTVCHQRADMDSQHRSMSAYRYDSLACYSCHPNGRKP